MHERVSLQAAVVLRQIEELLCLYPELIEDEVLRGDVLEGETDLHGLLSLIVDTRQEAKAYAELLAIQIDDRNERRQRFLRRMEAMNVLAKALMGTVGTEKVSLPEATISITKGRESVTIVDPDALPQGYFGVVRQPDKKAIGDALKRGEAIPGATLTKGEAGLTVRTR